MVELVRSNVAQAYCIVKWCQSRHLKQRLTAPASALALDFTISLHLITEVVLHFRSQLQHQLFLFIQSASTVVIGHHQTAIANHHQLLQLVDYLLQLLTNLRQQDCSNRSFVLGQNFQLLAQLFPHFPNLLAFNTFTSTVLAE